MLDDVLGELVGPPGQEPQGGGWGLVTDRARVWEYEGYRPEEEGVRETLCALGNGVFGVRAAVPGEGPGTPHYRGLCAAGCYSRIVLQLEGRTVQCEAVANLPDWLWTRVRPYSDGERNEPWLSVDSYRAPGVPTRTRPAAVTAPALTRPGRAGRKAHLSRDG
ncbi:hypothetical protein ABZ400_18735 [Streptomyces sp. NPDC005897]|uniref:hypothetical protein n=1 Tax=Streptomyces sp. NPDC005897 TaxID=3157081 RepID=UPI0033F3B1C2